MLARLCFVMVLAFVVQGASCAVTRKAVDVTQNAVTPCNVWVWVLSERGQPLWGARVWAEGVGMMTTDQWGYACLQIPGPTKITVDGGPQFNSTSLLMVPWHEPKEIRLSRLARAN